ncbi:WD40 repeat domain-containing protein, partial [Streptomyces lavendulae]|uniref:WD40 repeat domain-containing protein n=1 Tax=Streptomyces lavendulae TaxID=1914 RepID=UPI0036C22DC6
MARAPRGGPGGAWERWAQEWEFAGRGGAFLLTGERLADARSWLAGQTGAPSGLEVSPLVAEYVDRSARADGAARAATADAVAARVLESREPETAIGIARAAVTEWAPTPGALQALRTALDRSLLRSVRGGFGAAVTGAAWSPDGTRLAACSGDGRLRVWEADAGAGVGALAREPSAVLDVPGARPRAVAWSPDGALLVCATRDARLSSWETASWRRSATARHGADGDGGGHGALAFSPDGRRLVTAAGDGVLRLWDPAARSPPGARAPPARKVGMAARCPDG